MGCYILYSEEARPSPHRIRCTKCNSPPINSQCTNFVSFYVALQLPLDSKGLTASSRAANRRSLHHHDVIREQCPTLYSRNRAATTSCWSLTELDGRQSNVSPTHPALLASLIELRDRYVSCREATIGCFIVTFKFVIH